MTSSTSFAPNSLRTTPIELHQLLLDPGMIPILNDAIASRPVATALLRYYTFLSQNIEQIRLNLSRHQIEREDIFRILVADPMFVQVMEPVLTTYRRRGQTHSSPPAPRPTPNFHTDSSPDEPREVIIRSPNSDLEARSTISTDSAVSFQTTLDEPGTRHNPINVDTFIPSPVDTSPSIVQRVTNRRIRSAPDLSFCTTCRHHGHAAARCVWISPIIC